MLSAIRLALASARFSTMQMFDLALVAAGPDFISRTFIAQCKALGRPVAEFHWEVGTRAVTISHPEREQKFSVNFVLEDITSMRSDINTWPPELLQVVQDVLEFLDVSETQLTLPIAR